jgi:hypothetical protein
MKMDFEKLLELDKKENPEKYLETEKKDEEINS